MSTLLSTPGQVTMGGIVGSNALVNILKPVNIVNLGNTLRRGVGIFRSNNSLSQPISRMSNAHIGIGRQPAKATSQKALSFCSS